MAYFLIFIGAIVRVLPHPANFAPLGAIALFGGTYLNKKLAIVVPLAAMVMSDFFIGFDSLSSRLTVYGAFVAIGLLGMLIRRRKNVFTVIAGSLGASLVFFLITNFALFYPTAMYDHNLAGILASYTAGIPFWRNTVLSDLLYTAAFFGCYELVLAWKERRSHAVYDSGPR